MDLSGASAAWEGFKARLPDIDRETHPNDDMLKKSPKGWSDYELAGVSAIRCTFESLLFTNIACVKSVLDFGSGHGRVARHLRLAFPAAALHFSDIDDDAWQFCARQFGGSGFASTDDFSKLVVPVRTDLIFVGSVFTHLDSERCQHLWKALFGSLNPGGALVATFRGRECWQMMIKTPERFNMGGYYDSMINNYLKQGFGYQDYKGFVKWGQNLWKPAQVAQLANDAPDARLVRFSEAGWANIHDVGVWTKR